MPQNRVCLTIEGRDYYGWLSVSIQLSLTAISRSFDVSLTTKADEKGGYSRINVGNSVVLKIGKDKLLNGYVTNVSESYSGTQRQITIKGRSKTIDLVECCPPEEKPLSYKKQRPLEILKALAGFYGVNVVSEVAKQDQIDFDISPEEKILDGLVKLLRTHNLLLSDNSDGDLVLVRVGSGGTCYDSIQLGKNVLSAKMEVDGSGLFSRYVILGQGTNPSSERSITDNQLKRSAEWSGSRFRVNTIVQSGNAVGDQLQARVAMIRDASVAEAQALSYVVQGWRQSNKELWPVNAFVSVDDKSLGIKEAFLIERVTYSLNNQGMTTRIELKSPAAFANTKAPTAADTVKSEVLNRIDVIEEASWTTK